MTSVRRVFPFLGFGMAKRRKIDWERIEIDYRAGVKTLRQIGDDHGISHAAVSKRAKAEEWERDLSAKIRAKAKDKVTKASVTNKVTSVTEKEVIESEAELQSRIALSHREDIPKKRDLVSKLFAEIEAMTDGAEVMETIQEALASGGMEALAREVRKVTSLPQRIKGTSELVTAYKSLLALERQAFSLDDEGTVPGNGIDVLLQTVYARSKPLVDEN